MVRQANTTAAKLIESASHKGVNKIFNSLELLLSVV